MNINYDSPFNFKPIPTITPLDGYWQNGTWKFNMSEISAGATYQPSWIDIILKGNTALTLVNAKEDGLNYLKLFGGTELSPETYLDTVTLSGGCEQRNLPVGYTQVEYLEVATEGIYFATGINADINTEMEITASNITSNSAQLMVANCTSGSDYFRLAKSSSSQRLIGTIGSETITDNDSDGTTKFTAKINKTGFYVDGTLIGAFTNIPSSLTDVGEIEIFRGKYSNSIYVAAAGSRLHRARINQSFYAIPCKRNSDNALGIYEAISGTFILPSGTGSFTAGADVVVPSPTIPMDIVCNNGAVKVNRNLYSTQYHEQALSQSDGVTPSSSAGINVSAMVNCTNVKSFMVTTTNPQGTYRLFKYKPDGTFINAQSTGNPIGQVLVLPSDCGYFRIQYNYPISTGTENILIYNSAYSLNGIYTDGTQEVVTDSVGNTASAERLLAVGDYKDTQEVISGSVTRNIGITVLDGTETYNKNTSRPNAFSLALEYFPSIEARKFMLCTHFMGTTDLNDLNYDNYIFAGTLVNLSINASIADNATSFANWLADQYNSGNPVVVIYPLATATTESVTKQILNKSPVTQTAGSISNLPIAITESSHSVPTPQQPLQINCNNGVVKLAPNLLDRSKETQGVYINKATGNIDTTASPWAVSDYIPVTAGSKITISNITFSSVSAGYNYYNSQKTLVSTISYETGTHTYTVPNNASYIRICYRYEPDDNVRINVGDSANDIYADGTTETVEITGKNLFNPNQEFEEGYIDDNGNLVTLSSLKTTTGYIKVSPSTTYNISYIAEQVTISNLNISLWTADDTFISRVARHSIQNLGVYSANFITTSTTAKIKVTIWSDTNIYSNFQIEQGSTATTYEPYFNGGTATAEMLLAIGSYQDVQSVINGEVTRKVGIKVLDGTEDWIKSGTYTGSFYVSLLSEPKLQQNSSLLCTHGFRTDTLSEYSTAGIGAVYWYTTNLNYKYDGGTATVEQFKQWLADQYNAGTPVILVYPLATATTETVTGQPLTIQEGTNIVEITQASMNSLPLEVSYKAGVTVTITEVENAQLDNNVEVTIQ